MIKIVRRLDTENWSRFVYEHPQGNVFHTPEMFEVYEHTAKHRPTLWAAVEDHSDGDGAQENERILALFLPVQHTVFSGPLHRLTTRAVVYGSVLCEQGAEGERALDQLLAAYRQEVDGHLLLTELRNISPLDGLRPILEKHGFAYEEHLNFLLDLTRTPEEMMQAMGKRTRSNLRRALRAEAVKLEEVRDSQCLEECYALLRQTYAAARVPLADISLFQAALDILLPRNMIRLFVARVEGRVAACTLDLLYKDTVYGWYGATDRDFNRYSPNDVLTWNVLEWASKSGYRVYDFGGAGKPDEKYGVRDYKAKFAGDLVEYGRNTCVHAPVLLTASKMGYSLFRRLGLFSPQSGAEDTPHPPDCTGIELRPEADTDWAGAEEDQPEYAAADRE